MYKSWNTLTTKYLFGASMTGEIRKDAKTTMTIMDKKEFIRQKLKKEITFTPHIRNNQQYNILESKLTNTQ